MTSTGYWPSSWPVECGGNHRPKAAAGPGFGLGPTDRLVATTRHTGRWPVMFVQRDRDQLYLYGTTLGAAQDPVGWVERVDPLTLAPIARSGDLPAGGHEWCGSIAAHRNGDLYTVNGSYLHRLDPDCQVVAERRLPTDQAHNGLLILDDGSLATKDIRVGGHPSTLTILDPDLEIVATETLPEPSMGRLAAASGAGTPAGNVAAGADTVASNGGPGQGHDAIYVPGTTRLFRYHWNGSELSIDPGWQPTYRASDQGGLAWDPTIASGRAWFHDNGNIDAVEERFADITVIDDDAETGGATTSWDDPVRLIGIDLDRADDRRTIMATELPSGWVIAPPLVTAGIAVTWDTGNTGLAAFDISPGAGGEMLWFQPFRSSMQPLLFPESGELVTNDFRYLDDGTTSDDLVVIDVATGRMKARVGTGATRYNGMFLTPGWGRDLYYCSFETVARIEARSL